MLLLLAGSMTGYAQSDCFNYEDEGKTIINGLTDAGRAANSLTVPATVTTVRTGAFSDATKASTLIIEAGGNPAFAASLFDTNANPLVDIQIMGSSMTVASITALLTSLGEQGALSTVYIEGYSDAWSDISVTSVLTEDVSVTLPAALVSTQVFGNAKVYGRFTLAKDLVTFCGNATFQDTDDGSNMLFYVADGCNKEEGRIHINRVRYVAKGEGVLIHHLENTSNYADLLRVSTDKDTGTDASLYEKNMLVGVTEATTIGKTDGDKTNLVLSNGAFHPTSGGTIGANKAYLQVPTSALAAREMLSIDFSEETGIRPTLSPSLNGGEWYDLQGRKVAQPTKGLYINNGKKYVIR